MRTRAWIVAALLLAAALATLGSRAPAEAAFPGANGRIVFASDRDENLNAEIYAIAVDAGSSRNLTRRAGNDFRPVVSPNRRRILFLSGYEGSGSLWIMNADGTRRRPLGADSVISAEWSPDGRRVVFDGGARILVASVDGAAGPVVIADGSRPAWSPDGRLIAFVTLDLERGSAVHVVRPDGSGRRLLVRSDPGTIVGAPRWSPRSDAIAFPLVSLSEGSLQIRVATVDGGASRFLSEGAEPAWAPDGRRIAFVRPAPDGGSAVGVIDADGRRERVLTRPGGAEDGFPAWSPDGRWVAFARKHRAVRTDVWMVRPDGTGLRRVRRERTFAHFFQDAEGPVWLDRRRLLVARIVQGNDFELFSVAATGRGVRRLTRSDVDERDPAWSPDGRRIAFTRVGRAGPASLWVMRADGTAQRRLYSAGSIASPAWSPGGRRIAFTQFGRAPVVQIYVIGARGGRPRPVAGAVGTEPAWSPDGRRLAFVHLDGESAQLAVIPATGGTATTITVTDERFTRASAPSWSPDGRWIVFVRVIGCGRQCEEYRLARVRPDGRGLEELSRGPATSPAFSPDGRWIVYSSFPQGGGELRVLRLGGAARTITGGPGQALDPDWQPLPRRG